MASFCFGNLSIDGVKIDFGKMTSRYFRYLSIDGVQIESDIVYTYECVYIVHTYVCAYKCVCVVIYVCITFVSGGQKIQQQF